MTAGMTAFQYVVQTHDIIASLRAYRQIKFQILKQFLVDMMLTLAFLDVTYTARYEMNWEARLKLCNEQPAWYLILYKTFKMSKCHAALHAVKLQPVSTPLCLAN